MKASRHDPGPKPTRYVVFSPGSWKPGLAWPEATTAWHSRNSRTTTAAARRQSDGLFRGGPVEGSRWPIDRNTPGDSAPATKHVDQRRPRSRNDHGGSASVSALAGTGPSLEPVARRRATSTGLDLRACAAHGRVHTETEAVRDVREVYRPGAASRGPGSRRGHDAEPQLHRHRAS